APNAKQLVDAGGSVVLRDLEWPSKYRQHETELKSAIPGGALTLHDAKALGILGEWYAFRGAPDWAAEVLGLARAAGGHVSALTLARCDWRIGKSAEALREFQRAMDEKEAPEAYLRLCMGAVAHPSDPGDPQTRPSPPEAAE